MKRWNILRLGLYSLEGEKKEIRLEPGEVNIFTGRSKSGKSAIVEIIDYCLGSTDCHVPDAIRAACSWFCVAWVKGRTVLQVCRQSPQGSQRSTGAFYVSAGSARHFPDFSDLHANTNRRGALEKIESYFGIGDVRGEVLDSSGREGSRVSARLLVPFLLQSDEVIINKTRLLRSTDDEYREQAFVDALPYFLGVVDEETVQKQAQLRSARAQLRRAERQRRAEDFDAARAGALLVEAAEVGLAEDRPNLAREEAMEALRQAASWQPGDQVFSGFPDIESRQERERSLLLEIRRLQEDRRQAQRATTYVGEFGSATEAHARKLEAVSLFPAATDHVCPLCDSELPELPGLVEGLNSAMVRLRGELETVERDRPKLDNYLVALQEEIEAKRDELAKVRVEIAEGIKAAQELGAAVAAETLRTRVAGRISFFLEGAKDVDSADEDEVDRLNSLIGELEEALDLEARLEAIEEARLRLSHLAGEVAAGLPLGEEYSGCPIYLNLRTLAVSVLTAERRVEMRALGSDENYLTLHVALPLALHRLFAERKRPVPGVLVFDQLSRPYFPPDTHVEEVIVDEQDEREQLKLYFDALFSEVERAEDLQIIVAEHAYFPDDSRFVSATRERWRGDSGLIPAHWFPERGN